MNIKPKIVLYFPCKTELENNEQQLEKYQYRIKIIKINQHYDEQKNKQQ